MKYILIVIICLISFGIKAKETYYCEQMTGLTTPLSAKGRLWNSFKWFNKNVETTSTISAFQIVIDDKNSYLQDEITKDKTPLLLFMDNDEKAELLQIGTVASSIYTIDKFKKQIYQAKNGLITNKFKKNFNIQQGYQMIMKGNCR